MWRRGTTSTCVGAPGWMSRKAYVVSVDATSSHGTSPATILQNRQSATGATLASPPVDEVEALLADLARWTADTRAGDAARSRTRERWLRRQAEEDARFAGVLVDLSEADAAVAVRTTAGRTLHGRITAVARDFCVLRHAGGTATLLAFTAVATVRPEPGYPAAEAASERSAPLDTCLADALGRMAGGRPRVRLVVEGAGEALTGELRSVGADVATMRLDGGGHASTVYVQLPSVREVTLLG